ncbi:MAG: restriction endonuclease subunit S [Eubacteriales bacterium]
MVKSAQKIEGKLLSLVQVAEELQPFEVPYNWVWAKINSINCYKSKLINATSTHDLLYELYSVPSCENDYPEIVKGSEIGSTKQLVEKNDVLICKINPRINRVWIVSQHTENIQIASSEWIVFRNPLFNADYLKWFFTSNDFREFMLSNVSGVGGSLMRAQPKYVKEYPVPIPPLAEQQRIVERIENLFEKLDHAKDLVQNSIDSFYNRKSAILYQAFTGELTKKWREENNVNIENWGNNTVGSVCEDVKVGIVIKPSQYYTNKENGTPAFRSANVREFFINDCNWVYISEQGQSNNKRSIVHEDDVLVVRSGNPGTACVVTKEFSGYNAIDILIAVPNPKIIDSHYLCAYTNSPVGKRLVTENKRGMALSHFNVGEYSKLTIPLPSISEQKEIVRILNTISDKEELANELYDVIGKIDLMKKAILARAFRGELGTNDPIECNSIAMLNAFISNKV